MLLVHTNSFGAGTPLDPARCGSAPSVPQLLYPTCPDLFLRFQRLWVHLVHEDILVADVVIPFVQHIVHTAVVTGLWNRNPRVVHSSVQLMSHYGKLDVFKQINPFAVTLIPAGLIGNISLIYNGKLSVQGQGLQGQGQGWKSLLELGKGGWGMWIGLGCLEAAGVGI